MTSARPEGFGSEWVLPDSRQRDELPIGDELDVELRRWFEDCAERLGRPLRPTDAPAGAPVTARDAQ